MCQPVAPGGGGPTRVLAKRRSFRSRFEGSPSPPVLTAHNCVRYLGGPGRVPGYGTLLPLILLPTVTQQ
jgi:hypothetical protein